MGVGRNLAYTNKVFYNTSGFKSHYHILSGDDDLFINEAVNKNSNFADSSLPSVQLSVVDIISILCTLQLPFCFELVPSYRKLTLVSTILLHKGPTVRTQLAPTVCKIHIFRLFIEVSSL